MPYQARKHTNSRALKSICDLELRFNKIQKEKKTNIIDKNPRHNEVRKNPEELKKLNLLLNDLCESKELLEVPKISDAFETETNH